MSKLRNPLSNKFVKCIIVFIILVHSTSGNRWQPYYLSQGDDFPLSTNVLDDAGNSNEDIPQHILEETPITDLQAASTKAGDDEDVETTFHLDNGNSEKEEEEGNTIDKRMMNGDRMSHLFRDRRGFGADRMSHLFRDRRGFGSDRMSHLFRDRKAFGADRMSHLFRDKKGVDIDEQNNISKRFQKKRGSFQGSFRPMVRLWIMDHMTRRGDGFGMNQH